MRKSIWTLLFIGVFGFFAVIVMLLYTLSTFSVAGLFTKVAEHLKETYHIEKAILRIGLENRNSIFYIDYTTKTDSNYDPKIYDKEMEGIGKSAITLYEGRDKNTIESIHVTRTEIKGSGCFQNSFTTSKRIKNPLREGDFDSERY